MDLHESEEDEFYSDSSSDEDCDSLALDSLCLSKEEDEYFYEVISTKQIAKEMEILTGEVAAIINMEPTIIRILLNHFKWNKEKLYETYFNGDQEKLFNEAHVVNPNKSDNTESVDIDSYIETCLICYSEDVKLEGSACGHKFCVDCWKEYLKTKIMNEGIGMNIICPAYDCDIFVDDKTVTKLIKDAEIIKRYQLLITKSFVDSSPLLRWCPQPDCNSVFKSEMAIMQPVTCRCRYKCCFSCSEAWHEPVSCKLLKKWRSKCNEDGETAEWLSKNTKDCPNCGASIEKNGGCNHMTCNNASCQAEFCWVCLNLWNLHENDFYKCNNYVEDSSFNPARESNASEVRRYFFYCERYMNHMRSLKLQDKLYKSVEFFGEATMLVSEVSYYRKAVDILCECRRTLMHTYVFAYYVKRSHQLDIFLQNQKDLETATESLAWYLESDLGDISVEHLKNIQEKSIYCRRRCKVLLNHVEEGYDTDWWEFT